MKCPAVFQHVYTEVDVEVRLSVSVFSNTCHFFMVKTCRILLPALGGRMHILLFRVTLVPCSSL